MDKSGLFFVFLTSESNKKFIILKCNHKYPSAIAKIGPISMAGSSDT